jgi:hypothetical protein
MRTCTDCGETKLLEAFTPIRGTRWTHTRCKPCSAARARKPHVIREPAGGYEPSTSALALLRRVRAAQRAQGILTCTTCGETKPLDRLVKIKQAREAYYGQCKACRAKKAQERYYRSPDAHAAEVTRARKNARARRLRRGQADQVLA